MSQDSLHEIVNKKSSFKIHTVKSIEQRFKEKTRKYGGTGRRRSSIRFHPFRPKRQETLVTLHGELRGKSKRGSNNSHLNDELLQTPSKKSRYLRFHRVNDDYERERLRTSSHSRINMKRLSKGKGDDEYSGLDFFEFKWCRNLGINSKLFFVCFHLNFPGF